MKKWIIAAVVGAILCIVVMGGLILFSSYMAEKYIIWNEAEMALSQTQIMAINLARVIRRSWPVITPAVFILCLLVSFAVVIFKGKGRA